MSRTNKQDLICNLSFFECGEYTQVIDDDAFVALWLFFAYQQHDEHNSFPKKEVIRVWNNMVAEFIFYTLFYEAQKT